MCKETKHTINSALTVIVIAIGVLFVSCPIYNDPGPSPYDEEDRLSRDSINQLIERPAGWKRVVANIDSFQLSKNYTFINNSVGTALSPSGNIKYVTAVYNRSYGTFPAIDGSTVLLPLAAEFSWQYLDLSDDQSGFFNFSTTHNAFLKLIGAAGDNNTSGSFDEFISRTGNTINYNRYNFSKQPDIIFITSPSEAELNLAQSKGVSLTVRPVCYDSFVFITHIENPVDTLTVEQIRSIYSGQIRNWSEVGGADEEIVAFQRGPGSGSQTAMEEMVMDGIKMMSAPSGNDSSNTGGRFLDWMLSEEGQRSSVQAGYVPVMR